MPNPKLKPCENLYLNTDEADVWFVTDGERIPGHKLILTAISPWFKTMFCGALPEEGDVDMSENATAAEFKEFLQFFYLYDVKLTLANIQGVLNLAKQSMVEDFVVECEHFLMDKLTIDKMCWGYQLAVFYETKQLQLFCERAISINAVKIFRSDSFLEANYETVHRILKLNTLLCKEKCVFDACIAWAQAACRRNEQDPSDEQHLRTQLKDLLFEIRFISMTDGEFGTLLHQFSEMFSKEETQEIIFIRSRVGGFRPKLFNPMSRLFKNDTDESDWLTCNRFISFETGIEDAAFRIKRLELTTFSSSRPLLLRGFLYGSRFGNIRITVVEKREDDYILPIFENTRQMEYDSESTTDNGTAKAKLHMPIIIEPNVKYQIQLELEHPRGYKRSMLKQEIDLGHGITIQFHPSEGEVDAFHGVIQTLYFSSLDNWPSQLFRPHKPMSFKEFLKKTGRIFLKCLNVIVFATTLIM